MWKQSTNSDYAFNSIFSFLIKSFALLKNMVDRFRLFTDRAHWGQSYVKSRKAFIQRRVSISSYIKRPPLCGENFHKPRVPISNKIIVKVNLSPLYRRFFAPIKTFQIKFVFKEILNIV